MKKILPLGILFAQICALPAYAETREYNLIIKDQKITIGGKTVNGMSINDSVPAPTLNFTEGDEAIIKVENKSSETTSLHWHGLLVPAEMDGVPGLNYFGGIKPNESFTYKFKIRQSGTYWYHSHSGGQEARGLYGALIIEPKADFSKPDREYNILLSDFSDENPMEITNNLKVDGGHYNNQKRTLGDFVRDAKKFGLSAAFEDRKSWGQMRMDATDLADVSGYEFLINGKNTPQFFEAKGGERVKLRVINGSAMTFFDLRIPDTKLIVKAADGRDIEPVETDELRIGVAETYDIEFIAKTDVTQQLIAESLDRRGMIRAFFAPSDKSEVPPAPALRPPPILTMKDMGMGGMDMSMMDHSKMSDADMAQMHAAMGHSMKHGALLGDGGTDGSNRPYGWGVNAGEGVKVLNYADLASLKPQADVREADREIIVRLGGNMEKYIWTINGKSGANIPPIQLKYGERVKLIFVNETMMAHPMHLHGMFVQLNNGQEMEKLPDKHIVIIEPGQTYSAYLTANEIGEWSFHCHLLNHMVGGMMTTIVVAKYDGDIPPEMENHSNHKMQHETLLQHKYDFDFLSGGETTDFEANLFKGTDENKIWLKAKTHDGDSEAWGMYSRKIADFWDFQIGVGRDFADKKDFAVLGFHGLSPYFIETDTHLLIGKDLAKIESEFETKIYLTQKLFLEPKVGVSLNLSKNADFDAGLNGLDYGISLGYRITRKFLPYIGYFGEKEFNRIYGVNGQNDQFAIGARLWF